MYEGRIFRPPSEARSLILQVTVGCSHNRCTFCTMYKEKKFRIKKLEEIFSDIDSIQSNCEYVQRVFLADGDALAIPTDDIIKIMKKLKRKFVNCERISVYATSKDIIDKGIEDMKLLKKEGLSMIYMGIESGCDEILKDINKGVRSDEIIRSGNIAHEAEIDLSVTLISGMGGKEKSEQHALESAKVLNIIKPRYIGLLSLMVEKTTPLYKKIMRNEFTKLTWKEVLKETHMMISNLNLKDSVFRSNHASNYFSLAGTLNKDKDVLLEELEGAIKGKRVIKKESHRGL